MMFIIRLCICGTGSENNGCVAAVMFSVAWLVPSGPIQFQMYKCIYLRVIFLLNDLLHYKLKYDKPLKLRYFLHEGMRIASSVTRHTDPVFDEYECFVDGNICK
jgi:hypothetical protein